MAFFSFRKQVSIADLDNYNFVFVVSTGRCGTTFLSNIFGDDNSVVYHEREHHKNNYKVLKEYLRPIAIDGSQELQKEYMEHKRLPFMLKELKKNNAQIFFEAGHLINYGVTPLLLKYLKNIKIIRLRRDRFETALSFMTRPETNDIWNKSMGDKPYRWSMHPFDSISILKPSKTQWSNLSRFQKYLWAIDEVERQWQQFNKEYDFESFELTTPELKPAKLDELSAFIGIGYNKGLASTPINTAEGKGQTKPKFEKNFMVKKDKEYHSTFDLSYNQ